MGEYVKVLIGTDVADNITNKEAKAVAVKLAEVAHKELTKALREKAVPLSANSGEVYSATFHNDSGVSAVILAAEFEKETIVRFDTPVVCEYMHAEFLRTFEGDTLAFDGNHRHGRN